MPRGTKPGAARGTFKDPRYLADAAGRLRELRARSGLTQKEVAEAVGIRERAVYEWEKGERIPMAVLPEIAELFKTSTSFILHGIEPADTALAAIVDELHLLGERQEALRAEVGEMRERLDSVHDNLAALAEEVASALEAVRANHRTLDPPVRDLSRS